MDSCGPAPTLRAFTLLLIRPPSLHPSPTPSPWEQDRLTSIPVFSPGRCGGPWWAGQGITAPQGTWRYQGVTWGNQGLGVYLRLPEASLPLFPRSWGWDTWGHTQQGSSPASASRGWGELARGPFSICSTSRVSLRPLTQFLTSSLTMGRGLAGPWGVVSLLQESLGQDAHETQGHCPSVM